MAYLYDKSTFDLLGWQEPVLGADGKPINAPYGGLGKWGHNGLPHTGWEFVDYFMAGDIFAGVIPLTPGAALSFGENERITREHFADLPQEERDHFDRKQWPVCEMCETQPIQHVFKLRHPDCPDPIYVGYRCAGHLTGNMRFALDLDHAMKLNSRAVWVPRTNGNAVAHRRERARRRSSLVVS